MIKSIVFAKALFAFALVLTSTEILVAQDASQQWKQRREIKKERDWEWPAGKTTARPTDAQIR
jgi:hypothetical protein